MQSRLAIASGLMVWAGLLAGCRSDGPRNPYPNDPLLIGKKAVEGTPSNAVPTLIARWEPIAPASPAQAVAVHRPSNEGDSAPGRRPSREVVAQPAVTRKAPLVAIPAVRTKQPEAEPYAAAVPHPTASNYGRAADYSWLQGVLDKHSDGHFDLRYCDPAVADKWGGKVQLGSDPRLARFHDGDIVQVEGQLVSPASRGPQQSGSNVPCYRMHTIWLVQPKK